MTLTFDFLSHLILSLYRYRYGYIYSLLFQTMYAAGRIVIGKPLAKPKLAKRFTESLSSMSASGVMSSRLQDLCWILSRVIISSLSLSSRQHFMLGTTALVCRTLISCKKTLSSSCPEAVLTRSPVRLIVVILLQSQKAKTQISNRFKAHQGVYYPS